VALLSFFRQML